MINDFACAAEFYDALMGKTGEQWAKRVVKAVRKSSPNPYGADVGCGTGKVTRALAAAGFFVTGFDPSSEMLGEAVARGNGEVYVLGSMKDVKKLGDLGFVTAVNDVVNYLRPAALEKNFAAVYAALAEGGAFLFDLSTPYRLRKAIGKNLFGEDLDDLTYLWFNTQKKDGVLMELVYFIRQGDVYVRKEESFFEYAHECADVCAALENVGFKKIIVKGETGSPREDEERLYFTAIK
ncbi:MAG: hypothetical protein DBX59_08870 [Bacillota bacterium]|nr:MAG: hypothetical protein DBX59_08870 [Bacillota bacterium]